MREQAGTSIPFGQFWERTASEAAGRRGGAGDGGRTSGPRAARSARTAPPAPMRSAQSGSASGTGAGRRRPRGRRPPHRPPPRPGRRPSVPRSLFDSFLPAPRSLWARIPSPPPLPPQLFLLRPAERVCAESVLLPVCSLPAPSSVLVRCRGSCSRGRGRLSRARTEAPRRRAAPSSVATNKQRDGCALSCTDDSNAIHMARAGIAMHRNIQ